MLILIWQLENICIVLKYRKKSIVQTVYKSLHRNSLNNRKTNHVSTI